MSRPAQNTLLSGKPSICEWSLSATFKLKKQASAVVRDLMAAEVDFDVSLRSEMTATSIIYVVEIDAMPWANNLKTAARILTKHDYRDDDIRKGEA